MALNTDSLIVYPLSGSNQLSGKCNKNIIVYSSASFKTIYHPGGTMTEGILMLDDSGNRMNMIFVNSGTLTVRLAIGSNYLSSSNGLYTSKTVGNGAFTADTSYGRFAGPVYYMWEGSGTLSGSILMITEFFA